MRVPTYLSYSSMCLFYKDTEEFYLRYLADTRPPRLPQEKPMAAGSCFDAKVKSRLHEALFGAGSDPAYEFTALFESQVEPHNRDFALPASDYLFDCYQRTGAFDELLAVLQTSVEPPQFEMSVNDTIDCDGVKVPFTGKPDCRFVIQRDDHPKLHVILDWKVKGFCSKSTASPTKGYALCRDAYDAVALGLNKTKAAPDGKPSKSHNTSHKLYLPLMHRGLEINAGYMETCNDEYADQVIAYGWLLGEKPGDEDVVVWIDELVSSPRENDFPLIRVANNRARVSRAHQLSLLARMGSCWRAITSGHVFTDMSREESDGRCEVLDRMAVGLKTDGSEEELWFSTVTRPQYKR